MLAFVVRIRSGCGVSDVGACANCLSECLWETPAGYSFRSLFRNVVVDSGKEATVDILPVSLLLYSLTRGIPSEIDRSCTVTGPERNTTAHVHQLYRHLVAR